MGVSELVHAMADTVMVDAAWLAALADHGEVLPRCQEVPDEAKVRLEEMEAWWGNDAGTVGALIVSCTATRLDHACTRFPSLDHPPHRVAASLLLLQIHG